MVRPTARTRNQKNILVLSANQGRNGCDESRNRFFLLVRMASLLADECRQEKTTAPAGTVAALIGSGPSEPILASLPLSNRPRMWPVAFFGGILRSFKREQIIRARASRTFPPAPYCNSSTWMGDWFPSPGDNARHAVLAELCIVPTINFVIVSF